MLVSSKILLQSEKFVQKNVTWSEAAEQIFKLYSFSYFIDVPTDR